jgi:hypothetical protein
VTPAASTATVTALAVGAPQTASQTFTLECAAPGFHTYTFATAIAPANAADSDPNAANNQATFDLTVDCVVPVSINIMPGGSPNAINLTKDTVPVAVLTTNAGEYGLPLAFDATTIDPLSVRFGPAGAQEIHSTGHLEDSRELGGKETVKDGDLDMLLHFKAADAGLQLSDTQACVSGEFVAADGNLYRFFGCDAIRPVQ